MILARDIGATTARLGYFTLDNSRLNVIFEEEYVSQDYDGAEEIIGLFINKHNVSADRICMAVAGPVRHGRVDAPNLAWVVDEKQIMRALNLRQVRLINDLEANAHGIFALEKREMVTLNERAENSSGNLAVISAGTGLGEAGIYWDGKQCHPFAGEGGRDQCRAETHRCQPNPDLRPRAPN
jgi:glucokinase